MRCEQTSSQTAPPYKDCYSQLAMASAYPAKRAKKTAACKPLQFRAPVPEKCFQPQSTGVSANTACDRQNQNDVIHESSGCSRRMHASCDSDCQCQYWSAWTLAASACLWIAIAPR